MSAIGIETFPLGPLGTNSYLVHRDGEALAIDVGGDPAPVTAFLQAKGLKLLAILVTHQHFDHLYGVHALQEATGAPCFVPAGDGAIADTEAARGGIWGMPPVPAFESQPLPEGTMQLGGFSFAILKTPGHTPGSICLLDRENRILFSGDTVSYGPVFLFGKYRDIHTYRKTLLKLMDLEGYDTVYPCHNTCPVTPEIIPELIAAVDGALDGSIEGVPEDMPMPMPGGEAPLVYASGKCGILYIKN